MPFGQLKQGFYGSPDFTRTKDFGVFEDADENGGRSEIAQMYDNTGMEHIEYYDPPTQRGDVYIPSYFLGIDEEKLMVADGKGNHQISFDLSDLMQSTGKRNGQY